MIIKILNTEKKHCFVHNISIVFMLIMMTFVMLTAGCKEVDSQKTNLFLADMFNSGSVNTNGEFQIKEDGSSKHIVLISEIGNMTFTMPEGCFVFKITAAGNNGSVSILRDGVVTSSELLNGGTADLYSDIQPGETVDVFITGSGSMLTTAVVESQRTEKQVTLLAPSGDIICQDGNLTVRGTCTNVEKVTVSANDSHTEATVLTDSTWIAEMDGISDSYVTVKVTGDSENDPVFDEKSFALTHVKTEVVYASDMKWISATCHSSKPKPSRDMSFDAKNLLTINGESYTKGIGTHARDSGQKDAEISIKIPAGAAMFEAVVGLDDNMSPDNGNGSVEFIILLDDNEIASSGIMNAQTPNYKFLIDVSGADTITLRTTNGQDSAAYDAADWCNAKFILNTIEKISVLSHSVCINELEVYEKSYIESGDEITFTGEILPAVSEKDVKLNVLISAYNAEGSLIGRSASEYTFESSRTDVEAIDSEIFKLGSIPSRITVRIVNQYTHESLLYYEIPSDVLKRAVPDRTSLYDAASNSNDILLDRNKELEYHIRAVSSFGKVAVTLKQSSDDAANVNVSLYRFTESVMNSTYTAPVCSRNVTIKGETSVNLQFKDCPAGEYVLTVLPESGEISATVYSAANGGVLYTNDQMIEGGIKMSIYYSDKDAVQTAVSSTDYNSSSTETSKNEKQRAEKIFNGYKADLSTLPVTFKIGDKLYSGFGEDFSLIGCIDDSDGAKTSALITLRHISGLTAIIDMATYYDYAAFEWTVYFRNDANVNSPQISQLYAADMTFEGLNPTLNGIYGDAMNETTSEIMNNQPYKFLLEEGKTVEFAASNGRPTDKNFPYYDFSYGNSGALIAIGWEGQWASSFCYKDGSTRFKAKQQTFDAYLKPGETVRTPLMAFVIYDGNNSDRAANLWRRWFIDCNMPETDEGKMNPVLCGHTSDRTGCMTLTDEKQQIDAMKGFYDNGIMLDYWWMDAGWYTISVDGKSITELPQYGITGTWTVDKKRFPTKLQAISDTAAQLMDCRTLLWFEPERFGLNPNELKTDGSTIRKEWLLSSKDGYFLDYGNPDVIEWMTSRVISILEEGGISLYREDFNIPPLNAWQTVDSADRAGITENLYVQGHLKFWDNLRAHFPGMIIDTCASGGRRNDLDSLRRAIPLHISDYFFYDMNRRQSVHYSLFKWIPYFKAEATPDSHAVNEWNLRNAMVPWINIQCDFTTPGVDVQMLSSFIETWKKLNKYFYADYYTLTEWSIDDDKWLGWEFIDADEGGFAQFFRRAQSNDSETVIKFKGLNADTVYEITDTDGNCGGNYTGFELMKHGFKVVIPNANSSVLICMKALN